jgi:hypothetical protein
MFFWFVGYGVVKWGVGGWGWWGGVFWSVLVVCVVWFLVVVVVDGIMV